MKRVSCSCGAVVSAETGDELLAAVEVHIARVHAVPGRPEPEDDARLEAVEEE